MSKTTKTLTKIKTIEEIKKDFELLGTNYDARYILEKANEEDNSEKSVDAHSKLNDTFYYKAMTLLEFDKGILMLNAIPDLHRVFALELFKDIQKEYDCKTATEKSLAEVLTLNFIRILETQRQITYSESNAKTKYDFQYVEILSKELDRAQRHYLSSLQALRMVKMPQLEVSIRTQNAFVGNNQVLQKNEIN